MSIDDNIEYDLFEDGEEPRQQSPTRSFSSLFSDQSSLLNANSQSSRQPDHYKVETEFEDDDDVVDEYDYPSRTPSPST